MPYSNFSKFYDRMGVQCKGVRGGRLVRERVIIIVVGRILRDGGVNSYNASAN